jgi:redox-sensitive bicupin YhaK (pirin superfamily)
MSRIIDRVLPGNEVDMGGMPVIQPLPTAKVDQIDPFLLLHHHTANVQAGTDFKHAGVGPHPHRGFSPVTFIFKGDVHHRDSRGNSSIVSAGGVQWMDAGMGIIHSERPSRGLAEAGGEQEIVQLWINTPAALKMKQPSYTALQKDDMPRIDGVKGDVRLVAGSLAMMQGKIQSPVVTAALMGSLAAGDQLHLSKPAAQHAFIYVLHGEGFLKGFGLVEAQMLYSFHVEQVQTTLSAKTGLAFIYLSANPLNEKVEHYGPFVMNSQTQILEAMRDYQMGKMGFLVEEFGR